MPFPLLHLQWELILPILQKTRVVSFTRLRRTCHFIDDLAESRRKRIHIRTENADTIYLIEDPSEHWTSFKQAEGSVRHKHYGRQNPKNKGVQLALYDSNTDTFIELSSSFSSTNFTDIYAKLSGISVKHMSILSSLTARNRMEKKRFEEAFVLFLSIISKMRQFVVAVLWYLTNEKMKQVVEVISTELLQLHLSVPRLCHPSLLSNCPVLMLSVRGFSDGSPEDLESFDLNKLVIPRVYGSLKLTGCPSDIALWEIGKCLQEWQNGNSPLERFQIAYEEPFDQFNNRKWSAIETVKAVEFWEGQLLNNGDDFDTTDQYFPNHTPIRMGLWCIENQFSLGRRAFIQITKCQIHTLTICLVNMFEWRSGYPYATLVHFMNECFHREPSDGAFDHLSEDFGDCKDLRKTAELFRRFRNEHLIHMLSNDTI